MKRPIILIMAGGLGKRMNSKLPKVLHKIKDKPMLIHVIETSKKLNPIKIGIIVGKYKKNIYDCMIEYNINMANIEFINQDIPLGTGHAILCTLPFLENYKNNICFILSGDTPFIKSETLQFMMNKIDDAIILVSKKENPFGYGRIVIENNRCKKIIEEKDANEIEKKINIVNGGIYGFYIPILFEYLPKINNNNSQSEYYLTDIFEFLEKDKKSIHIHVLSIENQFELLGVNTIDQLNALENINCH